MSTQHSGKTTLMLYNFSKLSNFQQTNFSFAGTLCSFGVLPKLDLSLLATDNVYVFWHDLDNIKGAKVHFKVSILNENNEKLYSQDYSWELGSSKHGNRPLAAFISRAKLLDPKNGYLVDGRLTLLCEAKTIDNNKEQPNLESTLQQEVNNLSKNLQSLLVDGKFSDFTLIVGPDEKKFHVHKNILSVRSAVFAAMFEHDCEEKQTNEVKITDIDPETCDELLVYIYTGKVKQMDRYALDLLQAADKYQLESLKNICEDFLCSTLSAESAEKVLFVADLHGTTKLKDKCLEYICENANQMKDTDGWKILESNGKLLSDLFFFKNK